MTNLNIQQLSFLVKLYDRGSTGLRGMEPDAAEPLAVLLENGLVIAEPIVKRNTTIALYIFVISPSGKALLELLMQVNLEKFKVQAERQKSLTLSELFD